ncbi:MAG: DUF3575 domain-containing protein [Flavobacteriaceae bacterium]|nr:DUF3575 domain-containing protein [Flavobacteriaceae bacterium]
MKKITLIAILLIASFTTFAQEIEIENNIGNSELKVNMTNLIGLKFVDFTYERLINEESSFGVGVLVALDDELEDYRTFSLTPYYRHFFSNKYAQGFFVEAFTMIHSGVDEFYEFDSISNPNGTYVDKKYTDFAVGISTGYKVVSRRGFVAEIYAGIGRDLLNKSDFEVVLRGGISIGKRF